MTSAAVRDAPSPNWPSTRPTPFGIDLDPAMLAAARSRFPDIDVRAADATNLPLGDGQAPGYRADKLYHILSDPHAALAEARRVLRPGGRIVLRGQDWDAVVIDSDQPN
ncbi:MAG TPA: methyltransferase domain-containing protein [Chloroflexota bacterium]|nr:methyltransferase domain-containing protein [Chloroflexota bacterium]